MADAGIIELSTSFTHAVILHQKEGSSKSRLCLDLHHVNDVIIGYSMPLSAIQDIISIIAEKRSTFFSCLDCTSAYHQIDLRQYTSFESSINK